MGKDCDLIDCPRNEVGKCELSKLDKNDNDYTEPKLCTHYNWKKSIEK